MQSESISSTTYSPANDKSTCGSLLPPSTTKHNSADDAEKINSFVSSSSSNYISFKSHIQDCSSPYIGNSCNPLFANKLRNGKRCIVFNNQTLEGKKLKEYLNVLLDKRLTSLLILFASAIIVYKMVIVSMPLASSESAINLKAFAESCYHNAMEWANEQHQVMGILQSLLYGLAIAILGYALVYLDSDVPGVNPPSLYSPRRQMQYNQHKSSLHLGYLTAVAAGIVIGVLKYLDL